jgi:hypothetical protein
MFNPYKGFCFTRIRYMKFQLFPPTASSMMELAFRKRVALAAVRRALEPHPFMKFKFKGKDNCSNSTVEVVGESEAAAIKLLLYNSPFYKYSEVLTLSCPPIHN